MSDFPFNLRTHIPANGGKRTKVRVIDRAKAEAASPDDLVEFRTLTSEESAIPKVRRAPRHELHPPNGYASLN